MLSPVPRPEKTGTDRTSRAWGPALCSWLVDISGPWLLSCRVGPGHVLRSGHPAPSWPGAPHLLPLLLPFLPFSVLLGGKAPLLQIRDTVLLCVHCLGTSFKDVCASLFLSWNSWGPVFPWLSDGYCVEAGACGYTLRKANSTWRREGEQRRNSGCTGIIQASSLLLLADSRSPLYLHFSEREGWAKST